MGGGQWGGGEEEVELEGGRGGGEAGGEEKLDFGGEAWVGGVGRVVYRSL